MDKLNDHELGPEHALHPKPIQVFDFIFTKAHLDFLALVKTNRTRLAVPFSQKAIQHNACMGE